MLAAKLVARPEQASPNREDLRLRWDWLRQTDRLSLKARRALYLLIRAAADRGSAPISLSLGTITTYFRTSEERSSFAECFAELRDGGFVRNVQHGVYLIGEGLWRVGPAGDDDHLFFAAVQE